MHSQGFASRISATAMVAAAICSGNLLAGAAKVSAADLPAIKVSASNAVPACATPGRLQAFLAKRNPSLDPQFKSIAADYLREGEQLGIRWDVAFFQMLLETGNLTFAKGSRISGAKPEQNNFVGLRPVEKNAGFETFPDVATGVRAHLQHVMLYTGETVASPVAQRTRRLQDMGLLAAWRKDIAHDVTFDDLADKWTDGSDTYADRVDEIAHKFTAEVCAQPDPHPELMAAAHGVTVTSRAPTAVATAEPTPPTDKTDPQKVSSTELARRAMSDGSGERSSLGAAATAPMMPVKILNAPQPEAVPSDAPTAIEPAALQTAKLPVPKLPIPELPRIKSSAAQQPAATKIAVTGTAAKALAPPAEPSARANEPSDPASAKLPPVTVDAETGVQKCRVFTASYGGQRAVIVKAVADRTANFTVLDVNEGQEAREAEAYIAAYAKGGSIAGQFSTQDKALEKAFELCPEG